MKKTIKMIGMACLLGAFAFAGSSCKKEKTDTTSIKVSVPQVEVTDVVGERAYIDYSDSNLMKWSKDDTIAIYNLNEDYTRSVRNPYKLVSGANTPNGYFSGDVMGELNEGFDGYYAFYPYSKVKNHAMGPRNSQTFDVPATQNYNVDCMDPTSLVMAVKGENILTGFNMDHIFGFINLRLKGTKAVEKIEVIDNEFPLSGTITLDIPYITDGTAFVLNNRCLELSNYLADYESVMEHIGEMCASMNYSAHGEGNTITLECGGVQLNAGDYTRFIVTLRPGALHHGFSGKVYYTDQTSETFNKYNYGHADYGYDTNPDGINTGRYPRRFCVRPGNLMNFTLN